MWANCGFRLVLLFAFLAHLFLCNPNQCKKFWLAVLFISGVFAVYQDLALILAVLWDSDLSTEINIVGSSG